MKEIWRDIPNYEGYYKISSFGNIKSVSRIVKRGDVLQPIKERLMNQPLDSNGYKHLSLYKKGKRKGFQVHQLVAITFLNHKPNGHKLVVDHIDNNKLNNRLENLQIVTQRKNASKDRKGGSSKYTGVSWDSNNSKWMANINVNGVNHTLGRYNREVEARDAYLNKLKTIKND